MPEATGRLSTDPGTETDATNQRYTRVEQATAACGLGFDLLHLVAGMFDAEPAAMRYPEWSHSRDGSHPRPTTVSSHSSDSAARRCCRPLGRGRAA